MSRVLTKKINTNLKEAREAMGLSRKELASELSTTFETIRRWENGLVEPSLLKAIEIANYFGKTVDEMFWAD